jgi:hypothetical protein
VLSGPEIVGGDHSRVARMKQPHEMRPGSRYARDAGLRRTLGEFADAKMALIAVCRRCKHRRVLYTANTATARTFPRFNCASASVAATAAAA